jgi:hypothetical protein
MLLAIIGIPSYDGLSLIDSILIAYGL